MKKTIEILYLVCMTGTSATLGIMYSIYNTDSHHWGFIIGTALDYIHGRKLFSEVFIQYGIGQPLLFKYINYVIPVNYTRIGIITSLVYAINLVVIYFGIKKISTSTCAFLVTTIAFLLHPYAIYPWPDYFGGLCITLSCYFMFGKQGEDGTIRHTVAGLLLFFSFIFRNTYLIAIVLAIVSYSLLSLFNKRVRNKNIAVTTMVYLVLSASYIMFIYLQGNLHDWYVQGIGAASDQYGVNTASIAILIQRILLPSDLATAVFSGLLVINVYILCVLIFTEKSCKIAQTIPVSGIVIFVGLLGVSGIVQASVGYEIFRLQNACSPLYFVFAYFIAIKYAQNSGTLQDINFKFSSGILIAVLLTKFPYTSNLFPIIEGSSRSYSISAIPLFKGHKFGSKELEYYDSLSYYICNSGKTIVNLTRDSTIPYLCVGQENALKLPFYSEHMLRKIDEEEANRIRSGGFKSNEVVVVALSPPLRNLDWMGSVVMPSSIRFMGPGQVLNVFQVGAKATSEELLEIQ